MDTLKSEIAAVAARLVVEEGVPWGPAKRRAARQLGVSGQGGLPDNDLLEEAVREYLDLFHAETQPAELAALRRLALVWMDRLAAWRPYLAGPVWSGTATRLSDISIQLFCDDPKSAEFALLDHGVDYRAGEADGMHGEPVTALLVTERSRELGQTVGIQLLVYDHDDLRGALRRDARGRVGRGDAAAVRALLENNDHEHAP